MIKRFNNMLTNDTVSFEQLGHDHQSDGDQGDSAVSTAGPYHHLIASNFKIKYHRV